MRARVLPLERGRERGHRLEIRALEQRALSPLDREHVAEVARVEQQLFVVVHLNGTRMHGGRPRAVPGEPVDDREQLERAERLAHECLGSRILAASSLFEIGAREEDDRDLARVRRSFEPCAQLGTADAGHAQVEHDEIGASRPDARLGFECRAGLVHGHVCALEGDAQELAQGGLVVDQQNLHSRLACRQPGLCGFVPRTGYYVLVEAATALAAEASRLHVLAQERAGRVLRVAEAVLEHFHDGDARVEADEVGEGERPHRVREAELRDRVDRLRLRRLPRGRRRRPR